MWVFVDNYQKIRLGPSTVARPRLWVGLNVWIYQITLFCLGYRLPNHKMTIYVKHFGGMAPWAPLSYAYVGTYITSFEIWLDSTSRKTIGNLLNFNSEKITKLFQILFIVCYHFLQFFLSRSFNDDFLVKWGLIELGTSTNADLEIYPLNFGLVRQLN